MSERSLENDRLTRGTEDRKDVHPLSFSRSYTYVPLGFFTLLPLHFERLHMRLTRINPILFISFPFRFLTAAPVGHYSLSLRPVGSLLAARRTEGMVMMNTETALLYHPDHLSLTTLSHLIHPLSLRSFPCHSLSSENEENEMRRA